MASTSASDRFGRVGSSLPGYGAWIACCLGRGRRAPLRAGDVELLVTEFGESHHAGGTYVFRHGDDAARVHVVRTGRIELSRIISGRRVALQILRPGDVFGDVPAFLGEPEPFDARALEDCTILSLDVGALYAMLERRPLVARRWIVSMAERMSGLQDRLCDLLALGLGAQLASVLVRESADSGHVTLTQDQLAEMLGSARTSVQRVLKQLEQLGLIELGYRRIDVVDSDGLSELAGTADPRR